MVTKKYLDELTYTTIGCANEVHKIMGRGLLEEAQLLTYMKLLKAPKGILINFNCANIFNEGQKTFVNEYFAKLPNL